MNYKISINLPDAYRLKIEESYEFENSIFNSVYRTAKENLLEIIKSPLGKNNLKDDKILSNNFNNIICFVGERGQGKSSSMISFLKALVNKKKEDPFFCEDDISRIRFATIELVDPSLFKGDETLLEIILAKMFSRFKDIFEKDRQSQINDEEKRELVSLFQKVFENLKYINNRRGIYDEDSLDALIKLSTSSNLKVSFENLVEKYLKIFPENKTKYLVIAIDDFDLKTEGVHNMLEDIRRFLISNRIILLVACKIEQLREAIETNIYAEYLKQIGNNSSILSNIVDKDEIKAKAIKYVEKLIPESKRVSIPEVSRLDLKEILQKSSDVTDDAETLILETLYERLNLFLKKENYHKNLLLKGTLRSLISLLFKLQKTNDLDKSDKKKYLQRINEFQDSIKDFLQTFIKTEDIIYILECPSDLLNFRIIQTLSKVFSQVPDELINIRSYDLIQNGDVFTVLFLIDNEILEDNPDYNWYQSLKLLFILKQLSYRIIQDNDEDYDIFNRAGIINIDLLKDDESVGLPGNRDRITYVDSSKTIVEKINSLSLDDKAILASFIESLGQIDDSYRTDDDDIFAVSLGSGNNIISTLNFSLYAFFTAPYILNDKLRINYGLRSKDLEKITLIDKKWSKSKYFYLFNNSDFVGEFFKEILLSYDWLSRNRHLNLSDGSYYDFLSAFFNKGITRIFQNLNRKYPHLEVSGEDYYNSYEYAAFFKVERPALKEVINLIYQDKISKKENIYLPTSETDELLIKIRQHNEVKKISEIKNLLNFLKANKTKDFYKSTLEKHLINIDDSIKSLILNENYFNSLFRSGGNKQAFQNRERLIVELQNLVENIERHG